MSFEEYVGSISSGHFSNRSIGRVAQIVGGILQKTATRQDVFLEQLAVTR
jgi:hypothetical protein